VVPCSIMDGSPGPYFLSWPVTSFLSLSAVQRCRSHMCAAMDSDAEYARKNQKNNFHNAGPLNLWGPKSGCGIVCFSLSGVFSVAYIKRSEEALAQFLMINFFSEF